MATTQTLVPEATITPEAQDALNAMRALVTNPTRVGQARPWLSFELAQLAGVALTPYDLPLLLENVRAQVEAMAPRDLGMVRKALVQMLAAIEGC